MEINLCLIVQTLYAKYEKLLVVVGKVVEVDDVFAEVEFEDEVVPVPDVPVEVPLP